MKHQPPCQEARAWVKNRLKDKSCFAPFTGQDNRAFAAWVHLLLLYPDSDGPHIVVALRETLLCAQESVKHLFKAAIPWALDWPAEEELWEEVADPHKRALKLLDETMHAAALNSED